jgi:hypothetical protein
MAGKGKLDAKGVQAFAEGPPLLEEFAFFMQISLQCRGGTPSASG